MICAPDLQAASKSERLFSLAFFVSASALVLTKYPFFTKVLMVLSCGRLRINIAASGEPGSAFAKSIRPFNDG